MPPKPSLRPDSGKTNGSKPRALKGPTQEEYEGLRKQLVARDANIEYLRNNLDPQAFASSPGVQDYTVQVIVDESIRKAEEVIFKLKNGLPVDNSSEELKNMKKEIESLQSKMRSSEYLQGSLRSKCKEQAHEIEELRQRLAGTEEELRMERSTKHEEMKALKTDVHLLREEKSVLEGRNKQLEEDIKRWKSELNGRGVALKAENTKLESNYSQALAELNAVNEELNEMRKQAEENKDLANRNRFETKERYELEIKVERVTLENDELKCRIEDCRREQNKLECKVAELKINCHEAFTKLEDKDKELKNKGGDYKQLIERKEETINKLRRESRTVDPAGDAVQLQLKEAQKEIAELRTRFSGVVSAAVKDVEIEDLKSKLETMKREKDRLEDKVADLRHTCHEAFTKLEAKDKETKKKEEEYKKLIERKEETINKLRRENRMANVS
ncbi:synaptonemal complex protein 1-like isoform X1 [Mya arenaria]|uniref:synaptonemal complex protein 1-like isoform X1 n=1 Tax=Mya arenaria TaxID=6604 RepID=UPI0022E1BC6E|nr:synaptonemal complex protein 1-like isoform X1 [Mya arenaria]